MYFSSLGGFLIIPISAVLVRHSGTTYKLLWVESIDDESSSWVKNAEGQNLHLKTEADCISLFLEAIGSVFHWQRKEKLATFCVVLLSEFNSKVGSDASSTWFVRIAATTVVQILPNLSVWLAIYVPFYACFKKYFYIYFYFNKLHLRFDHDFVEDQTVLL